MRFVGRIGTQYPWVRRLLVFLLIPYLPTVVCIETPFDFDLLYVILLFICPLFVIPLYLPFVVDRPRRDLLLIAAASAEFLATLVGQRLLTDNPPPYLAFVGFMAVFDWYVTADYRAESIVLAFDPVWAKDRGIRLLDAFLSLPEAEAMSTDAKAEIAVFRQVISQFPRDLLLLPRSSAVPFDQAIASLISILPRPLKYSRIIRDLRRRLVGSFSVAAENGASHVPLDQYRCVAFLLFLAEFASLRP